jgi:Kef-type K+ transport system membrane component KefB
MSTPTTSALPYHEPDIVTILIQSSLLLALNVVNHIFDKLIFCGLLGQVFIGVAWGTPGAKWLDTQTEDVVVQLGYLGLILLVYEGGLETNFKSLKANALLSVAVAITGIGMPMALSFSLQALVGATPLQAFAAGAALSSTSLGTTFTILNTSGLTTTRLGTVLTSAAMMDDVVGLVMVQVVSNLGTSAESFSSITVVRPIAVSIAFLVAVLVGCRFVVKPGTSWLVRYRQKQMNGAVDRLCRGTYMPFIIHTAILLGFVTGSSYAGTSNLFAAYLAGAAISWWDDEVSQYVQSGARSGDSGAVKEEIPQAKVKNRSTAEEGSSPSTESPRAESITARESERRLNDEQVAAEATGTSKAVGSQIGQGMSGHDVFETYYAAAVHRVLKPFFFASIGLAIPITEMFSGAIVWRGIVYTILMLFGKVITGLWLVRLNVRPPKMPSFDFMRRLLPKSWQHPTVKKASRNKVPSETTSPNTQTVSNSIEMDTIGAMTPNNTSTRTDHAAPNTTHPSSTDPAQPPPPASASSQPTQKPKAINKPISLYPAAMLGTAMTARGEIGFLIASVAETTGVFSSSSSTSAGSSELYLVTTWAIVLCTIIGPLSVGTLVKRVRRLQREREGNPAREDPLGVWGVN